MEGYSGRRRRWKKRKSTCWSEDLWNFFARLKPSQNVGDKILTVTPTTVKQAMGTNNGGSRSAYTSITMILALE